MSRLEEIKLFVVNNKELFDKGITIRNVCQKWNVYQKKQLNKDRRPELDRRDVVDALNLLRREGVLVNNFKLEIMEYND